MPNLLKTILINLIMKGDFSSKNNLQSICINPPSDPK